MKPVQQTRTGGREGNCFEACVASILEVGVDEIPRQPIGNAGDMRNYLVILNKWLEPRGVACCAFDCSEDAGGLYEPPPGYWIAAIRFADAKYTHSIVAKGGQFVHDPEPSLMIREITAQTISEYAQQGEGNKLLHDVFVFVALDPAART